MTEIDSASGRQREAIERRVAVEFDGWAAAGRGESMAEGHSDITEQALARIELTADDTVLDVACGIGWATHRMRAAGAGSAWGVDISAAMIGRAQHSPGVAFAVASASALPFVDGAFSAGLSVEALYYCPDLPATLGEIRRVLRPGARFLCVLDLYADNPGAHGWVEALDVDVHLLSAAQWAAAFGDAGFERATTAQIPDRRPMDTEEQFEPSRWFETYEAYRTYRELGGLLIDATA